jgi:hypothetical protein
MNLYEFSDEPLRQEVVSYDFLSHLDEAKFTMPSEPPGRPKYDYRVMGGIGDVRRYALRTVPPAEIEFSLSLPERPRMRFALGRQFPPCLNAGGFQLWMVPENGEKRLLLQQTLSGQIPTRDVGWFEQQVDLSPWAGRRVNLLFKTDISGGECAWSLWADPVVVSLP